MWLPLVVGVDGSPASLLALDWAVDEAAHLLLPVRLVHAETGEHDDAPSDAAGTGAWALSDAGARILASAMERAHLRDPSVKVTADVVHADAVSALLREGPNASALVTGARGRGGLEGLLLGSVSLAVAANAQCPVVVVRDRAAASGERHTRMLLGVKDAVLSSAAVEFAFQVAEARGCGLEAVTAWSGRVHTSALGLGNEANPEERDAQRAEASLDEALAEPVSKHPAVDVRRNVVRGQARDVLLKRSTTTDLLIVGAKRRRSRVGMHLGRVNHAMLHYADCPVAVVPQWATPDTS